MGQAAKRFPDHVADAVVKAVVDAKASYPSGFADQSEIDGTVEGMCHAISTLACMIEQALEDRRNGAKTMGDFRGRASSHTEAPPPPPSQQLKQHGQPDRWVNIYAMQ
jgi:hypothetical protein